MNGLLLEFTEKAPLKINLKYKDSSNNLINLTDYSAVLQCRDRPGGILYLALTSQQGFIVLNESVHNVKIYYIPPLNLEPFNSVYQLRLIDSFGIWGEPILFGECNYNQAIAK